MEKVCCKSAKMTEFIVKHSGKNHNVARFLHFHPGGSNTLRSFEGCDITAQLEKTNHSPSAYELLKDYRLTEDNTPKNDEEDMEVCFVFVILSTKIKLLPLVNCEFTLFSRFQSLVNWEKAMFWQVGSLGENYSKWVLSPVDRKLRLFQYDFMEMLTVTPWYLVPSVWIPVSTYFIYCSYLQFIDVPPYGTHVLFCNYSAFGVFYFLTRSGQLSIALMCFPKVNPNLRLYVALNY